MVKTKFAIGCLIQWYECDIIEEYLETLRDAIDHYDGQVTVTFTVDATGRLEKPVSMEAMDNALIKIKNLVIKYGWADIIHLHWEHKHLVTIADYRRDFNDKFCDHADVLVWGESDMLVPKQMFTSLDLLHQNANKDTPKYLATFGTCKMWDDSWGRLEHVDFTNKPFIPNDYDNWWSVKYTMSKEEMNSFNDKVEELGIVNIQPHKFNGCGLIISSEVIKSGINIPKSVFFVHEDTSFMLMTQKVLGNIPQYHFKNILLVHNRNHPKKRNYIKGERKDGTMNEKRRSNDWYVKANKMSEQNCYNLFNPNYRSFTWDDVWK